MHVSSIKPLAKSLAVTADGKEYLAKKDSGITAGMNIEAQIENSDYNGKTYHWIKKWKASNGSAAPQVSAASSTTGDGRYVGPLPAGAAPVWLPMASNITAHAINAGIIKEPDDIKAWIAATKQAFTELA